MVEIFVTQTRRVTLLLNRPVDRPVERKKLQHLGHSKQEKQQYTLQ